MEDVIRQYLISGRVQGVGFRAFTERHANSLAIRGWVRNLSDGRVEVAAQGPLALMERFEAHLRDGPGSGRVDDIRVLTLITDLGPGFEIRKDSAEPCTEN